MKKTFRKILMSVIYVMLVMPVWCSSPLPVEVRVYNKAEKKVSGVNVTINVDGKTYSKKTDSSGLATFDRMCSDVLGAKSIKKAWVDQNGWAKAEANIPSKCKVMLTTWATDWSDSSHFGIKVVDENGKAFSGAKVKPVTGQSKRVETTNNQGLATYQSLCGVFHNEATKFEINATGYEPVYLQLQKNAKPCLYTVNLGAKNTQPSTTPNVSVKMKSKATQLQTEDITAEACTDEDLVRLHATAGKRGTGKQACVPTVCMDGYELKGEICEQIPVTDPNGGTSGTPGTPGVTNPNGGTPGTPTVPGTTDPNIAVTPIVVNPVVVTPAPKVATCQTPIKVDAVRSALGNAPADMDKQKFMDTLSSCSVVTVCEILEACVKSVPAGVACKECERFIRDIVGYHNG